MGIVIPDGWRERSDSDGDRVRCDTIACSAAESPRSQGSGLFTVVFALLRNCYKALIGLIKC